MDELLEKYLRLNESERAAFEKELSAEQREELATELGIMEGLNSEFRNELKAKVGAFEQRSGRVRKMNPAFIGIAASFLLVCTFAVYFLRGDPTLYDQYYESYENYEVTALRGESDLPLREQAYKAYDDKDFVNAEGLFSQYLSEATRTDDPARFFRGVARMELRKFELAKEDFDVIYQSTGSAYIDAAYWYAALCAVRLGDIKEAKVLLSEIIKSPDFSEKALKLKDEL